MKKGYVIVNGEYVPVKSVKFIDIAEDFLGRDIMTFEYLGKVCKSFIFGF